MRGGRDRLWADLLQFDHDLADRAWDGDLRDPDAPKWYGDIKVLVGRARGPAEAGELIDEEVVVDAMHRITMGMRVTELSRRRGARRVARVVALKAVAATTAGLTTVAAAAATGIVATMAATVVVPAVDERLVPMLERQIGPALPSAGDDEGDAGPTSRRTCESNRDRCAERPDAPVTVDARVATVRAPSVAGPTVPARSPAPADAEPDEVPSGGTTDAESAPVDPGAAATPAPTSDPPTDPATAGSPAPDPPDGGDPGTAAPPDPPAEAPAVSDRPPADPPSPADPTPASPDDPTAADPPSPVEPAPTADPTLADPAISDPRAGPTTDPALPAVPTPHDATPNDPAPTTPAADDATPAGTPADIEASDVSADPTPSDAEVGDPTTETRLRWAMVPPDRHASWLV